MEQYLGVANRGAVLATCHEGEPHFFPERANMPDDFGDLLEKLVFAYGATYDSYTVMEQDCACIFLPGGPGALCFHIAFSGYHVIGGLFAPEGTKADLIEAFRAFCAQRRKRAYFYNIGETDLPHFRSRNFQITRWGGEPVKDLSSTQWRGKRYEWIRRQENYCRRQGLSLREVEIGEGNDWPALRRQLETISESHIRRSAHGRELKVFEGSLDFEQFGRRRLFIAESPDGPKGLLVCNPCFGGERWAFEIYRQCDSAPRGTIPFMFLQAMRSLQDEGVREVSLSLVPGLDCHQQVAPYSLYFSWVLRFWRHGLNWLFDFRGLYHFKSRFRPDFEARYIAADGHFGIFASLEFSWLWGVFTANPAALARRVASFAGKAGKRRTMARPDRPLGLKAIEREL